jgi:hypothetical protein
MEDTDFKSVDDMRNVDIRAVNKNSLIDLNSVKIDETRPIPERIADFVKQIQNPYCFRIGDVAVKVVYKAEGPTFQQNLEDLLRTM